MLIKRAVGGGHEGLCERQWAPSLALSEVGP